MLELNGSCARPEMGETPGPRKAELLLCGFFLPLRKLFDIVDGFAPEVRREIVNHAVHGFCGGHEVLPWYFTNNGIPHAIIYSSSRGSLFLNFYQIFRSGLLMYRCTSPGL